MYLENEKLLQDIRTTWTNALLVNRAGRSIDDISVDIDNGTADLVPVGVWSLANPGTRLRSCSGTITTFMILRMIYMKLIILYFLVAEWELKTNTQLCMNIQIEFVHFLTNYDNALVIFKITLNNHSIGKFGDLNVQSLNTTLSGL